MSGGVRLAAFIAAILFLAAASSAATVAACGTTLSAADTYYLTASITSANATCITISSHNVTLDCGGYSITDTNGADGQTNYGVVVPGAFNNVTVRGCVIDNYTRGVYLNTSGANNSVILNNTVTVELNQSAVLVSKAGVFLYYARNASVFNNSFFTYAVCSGAVFCAGAWLNQSGNSSVYGNTFNSTGWRGYGVDVLSSNNTSIFGNSINTSGDVGTGVRVESSSNNTSVYGNFINTSGTSSSGIFVYSSSSNNSVYGNLINTSGSGSNGVYVYSSSNNGVYGNFINTSGPTGYGVYVYSSSNNNNVSGNFINTSGNSGYGICVSSSSSNNSVSGNLINTSGTSGYGVYVYSSSNNNNVSGNFINTSGNSGYGICVSSSSSNNVSGNLINTSGTSGYGVYVYSSSSNNLVSGNFINTSGSSGHGVRVESSSSNNLVSGNFINTSGSTGYGVYVFSSSRNNQFANNSIYSKSSRAVVVGYTAAGNGNNTNTSFYNDLLYSAAGNYDLWINQTADVFFTNVSFNMSKVFYGEDTVSGANNLTVYISSRANVTTSAGAAVSGATVNISNGTSIANYATDSNGLTSWTPFYLVFAGNNTANTTRQTFYNVTKTGYVANNTATQLYASTTTLLTLDAQGCGTLTYRGAEEGANSLYQLAQNVTTSNATCFTIASHNVTLDCGGWWIRDTNGADGTTNYGVVVNGAFNNVTVRGCTIDNYTRGVYLNTSGANNSVIFNNTVTVELNQSAVAVSKAGVFLYYARNASVLNNSFLTYAVCNDGVYCAGAWLQGGGNHSVSGNTFNSTGVRGYGVYAYTSSSNNSVSGNFINTSGTSGIGVCVSSSSSNNSVSGNFINTRGDNGYGVFVVSSSNNNSVFGNFINTSGSNQGRGVYVYSSSSNLVSGNFINTSGTNGYGVSLDFSNSNSVFGNFINASSSSGRGVFILYSSSNNQFANNSIYSKSSRAVQVGYSGAGYGNNTNNSFTNDVLYSPAGNYDVWLNGSSWAVFTNVSFSMNKVFYGEDTAWGANNLTVYISSRVNVTTSAGAAVSGATVNVSNGTSIANYTTDSNGLTGWTPFYLIFAGNDTANSTYQTLFNVTNAGYVANNTATQLYASNTTLLTLAAQGCGILSYRGAEEGINSLYALAQNLTTSNATCFTIASPNVTLDCGGWWIRDTNGSGSVTTNYGVVVNGAFNNVTVRGCNIDNYTRGIALNTSGANNSVIFNNTVTVELNQSAVTVSKAGLYLYYARNASVLNNSFLTFADCTDGTSCAGAWLQGGGNNSVAGNTFNSTGYRSHGVYVLSSSNNSVFSNFINTSGASGYGVGVYSSSSNNSVYGNFINARGSSGAGVRVYSSSSNNVSGNFINYSGSAGTCILVSSSSSSNLFSGNLINASGSDGHGIEVSSSSSNLFSGNFINTSGSSGEGAWFYSSSSNNQFANNSIYSKAFYPVRSGSASVAGVGNNTNNSFTNDVLYSPAGGYDLWLNQSSWAVFTNVSFSMSKVFYGQDTTFGGNNLTVYISSRANVTTTAGAAVSGATVNVSNGTSIANYTTGADGLTSWTPVYLVFAGNDTANTTYATTFNVTKTAYAPNNTAMQLYASSTPLTTLDLQGCGTLTYRGAEEGANSLYTLGQNLTTNAATCFNITSDNVTLDCGGWWIRDVNGSGSVTTNYGVLVGGGFDNVTVRGCGIDNFTRDIALNVSGADYARIWNNTLIVRANQTVPTEEKACVYVRSGQFAAVYNNAMQMASDAAPGNYHGAARLVGGGNSSVYNNSINTTGKYAFAVYSTGDWTSVYYNTLNTTGYAGWVVYLTGSNHTVADNAITAYGQSAAGVFFSPSSRNRVLRNSIVMYGSSAYGVSSGYNTCDNNSIELNNITAYYGVRIRGSGNVVQYNNILATSAGATAAAAVYSDIYNYNTTVAFNNLTVSNVNNGTGIWLYNSTLDRVYSNAVTVAVAGSYGIRVFYNSSNNAFWNNTVNSLGYGLAVGGLSSTGNNNTNNSFYNDSLSSGAGYYDVLLNQSSNAILTNVSFNMSKVFFGEDTTFGANNLTIYISTRANVTSGAGAAVSGATVNVSNGTSIANLTTDASGLTAWTPFFQVFSGNGTSNTSGPVFYNVSKADYYPNNTPISAFASATHGLLLSEVYILYGCANLAQAGTYALANNLTTSNATCIQIQSHNVTLDCGGYWIRDTNGADGTTNYGVVVPGAYNNVTVRGCTIDNYTRGVYLNTSGANNSVIFNNTLAVELNSTNVTVSKAGVFLYYSRFANVSNNSVSLYPNCNLGARCAGVWIERGSNSTVSGNALLANGSSSHGVYVYSSSNNSVSGNNVTANCGGRGVYLRGSSSNVVSSNSINTSGSNYGYGVFLESSSSSNGVFYNLVNTSGLNGIGVCLSLSNSNNVSFNSINTGGSDGYGFYAVSSTSNVVSGNFINTSGSGSNGVYVDSSSNNGVYGNFINTSGPTGYGVYVYSSSNNNNVSGNFINTSGNSGYGICVSSSSSNNSVSGNLINTSGSSGFGVDVRSSSSSNVFANNSIFSKSSRAVQVGFNTAGYGNNTNTSFTNDVLYSAAGSYDLWVNQTGDVVFTNVSFNTSKVFYGQDSTFGANNLTVRWYARSNVSDSATLAPVGGASVNVTRNDSAGVLYETTDATGLTPWRVWTQFVGNGSWNVSYTPLRFFANKTGYFDNESYSDLGNASATYLILLNSTTSTPSPSPSASPSPSPSPTAQGRGARSWWDYFYLFSVPSPTPSPSPGPTPAPTAVPQPPGPKLLGVTHGETKELAFEFRNGAAEGGNFVLSAVGNGSGLVAFSTPSFYVPAGGVFSAKYLVVGKDEAAPGEYPVDVVVKAASGEEVMRVPLVVAVLRRQEKLLDVIVSVPEAVVAGEALVFSVHVENVGDQAVFDVFLKTTLVDSGGAVVSQQERTLALTKSLDSSQSFDLPPGLGEGGYLLYATARYYDPATKAWREAKGVQPVGVRALAAAGGEGGPGYYLVGFALLLVLGGLFALERKWKARPGEFRKAR